MNAEWKGWAVGAVVAVFAAVAAFLWVPAGGGEAVDPLDFAGPDWKGWTRWDGRAAQPWGVEWVMRFEADSAWAMVAPAQPQGEEEWQFTERGWWAGNAAGRALWSNAAVDERLRAAWHPQRHGVTTLVQRDGVLWSTFQAVDLEGAPRPMQVTSLAEPVTAGAEFPASWSAWRAAVRSGQIPNLLSAQATRTASSHPALCGRGNGTTLELHRVGGDHLTLIGWTDSTGMAAEWRARGADWTDSVPWARITPDGLLVGHGDWTTPPSTACLPPVDAWSWSPESGYAEAVQIGPGRLAWSQLPHAPATPSRAASEATPSPTATEAAPAPTAALADASRDLGEVRNHRTGKRMAIRLEDGVVKAYEAGSAVWSIPLEGDLLGTAHEVDLYANGKYQTAFATTRGVHLIDVLGREVKGFPIAPAKGITAWLLADYDRNRKYRFLVATGDGKLLNYRDEGEQTPGWQFEPGAAPIAHLAHLRVGARDYLYAGQTDAQVRLLSRTGSDRATTSVQVLGVPAFRLSSTIGESTVLYIDGEGWVEERTFGTNEPVGMSKRTRGTRVTVQDSDRDGKPEIEVWDATGNRTRWNHRNEPME